MEDGAFTPNTTVETFSDTMDFDLMDDLLLDGCWLETTEESNLWQYIPSTSETLNFSSYCIPTSDTNLDHLNTFPHEKSHQEGLEISCSSNNSPVAYAQMDELIGSQTQNQAAAFSSLPENFLLESHETGRRFWIPPSEAPTPASSVKKRLMQAIEFLRESTSERDVLIQIWVPIKRGGKHVLTTNEQPYSLSSNCKNLADYRAVSKNYQFAAEENSNDFVGLPSRVFLKKSPEWTPDVRFFKSEEYPRVNHALQFNVSGTLAFPVFERGSRTCLGVVEIVTTTQQVKYRPELENVCKALEAVDLRSSEISGLPTVEACDDSYKAALTEIHEVLKFACDTHGLPLAQTWAPCIRQGKSGCRHSRENYARCVSTIDSACYVRNPKVLGFHEACSEHHLLQGEGIVGRAFLTNQSCFASDITALSKVEYPLSHHAKLFELCAAVAIRLRSIYSGSDDFVLEFFLPSECRNPEEQRRMLSSLSSGVQQICRSLHVVTDHELVDETGFRENVNAFPSSRRLDEEDGRKVECPVSKEPSQEKSPLISNVREAQRKGKEVSVLLEPEEEFKDTCHNDRKELYHEDMFLENKQIHQDSIPKGSAASGGDVSSVVLNSQSGVRKAGEKRRTKTEKSISLQVLRPYFSGSLKDAAKGLGVCPTTLKRICRQHGITRWPSRKIKKVGHSLKKLQRIIDSVQGVDGSIQLGSFYSKFPDLSSPDSSETIPVSTSKISCQSKSLNTQSEGSSLLNLLTTNSKSPSSSCSHSSSSSFCSFTEAKQPPVIVHALVGDGVASLEEPPGGVLKRAPINAEEHNYGQEETKPILKTHSHEISREPPLPKDSDQVLLGDGSGLRVKATFGEEKILFSVQQKWGFRDLEQQIVRRFNIDENTNVNLKYLDDDSEWVLLTCDADLEECIDLYRSSNILTIKLSVHQSRSPNLASSFGVVDHLSS